jgi:uncharacterized protein YdbL (DUF1318 family)
VSIATRLWLTAALLAAAAPAVAQDSPVIVQARQAGIVGERYDGYLGYSATAGERVRRQVGEINIKRRSLYTGLAVRRRATVQEVGIAAGCELLRGVKVGEIYMLSDSVWRRRAAGQPEPVPSYCGR